jgi:hypothetical protein
LDQTEIVLPTFHSASGVVRMADVDNTARVVLSVRPADGHEAIPEVEVAGDRAGLEWLAERILAIARAEPERHTHLDEDADAPVFQTAGGWWLTISRVEALRGARRAEPGAAAEGGDM